MDTIITYDLSDLTTLSIYDGTTFIAPASVSDIKGVRMLFETVNSVEEIETDVTTFTAWKEYYIASGTATANGVDYPFGSYVIFANDTTPSGTFTAETTGKYGQYISDNLPSSGTAWTFTPEQCGRTPYNTSYFQDEIYTLTYEFYETEYVAGATLASGTYLVVGTQGESVLIDGTKTLYVGETYTSSGSETFSGTSTLVLYSEESQYSFATLYQSFLIYQAYLRLKATSTPPSSTLDSDLLTVISLFSSPFIAADTTNGISLTNLQNNIDRIIEYYGVQNGI